MILTLEVLKMHGVRLLSNRLILLILLLLTVAQPVWARMLSEEADADSGKDKGLPLKVDRTYEMDTDEGSWISLDVSPDGRHLVFDLMGDLYTLPIDGGTAEVLTRGMPFDAQPRYSPDGRQVLFVSDRDGGMNVWTIDVNTKETKQLTKGKISNYQSPEWMPDGKYVVFSKGEGRFGVTKLWMQHVDGGKGIQLIKEPDDLRTVGAAPSPDGRHIWYARRTGTWQYNAILPQYQLAYYDRDTGETYTRTSRQGSAFRPTLSPDGRWLVYGTRFETQTGLRVRDLNSGDERWLAYPVQRDDQESVASRDVLPGMSFTPDSRYLVTSYGGKIWKIGIEDGQETAIPFQAHLELALGPKLSFQFPIEDSSTFTVRQIRDAVPSPDESKLAFSAMHRLYVMDFPGGEPQRLTSDERTEAEPAWSPDGRWLAYVTWSDEEGGHLYKVPAAGGQPQRLSQESAIYQNPAWSPDGDRIVLVRGPARSFREATGPSAPGASDDLVWIPASGGPAQLIAPADGRGDPHFTQDPDRIYLFHGRRGLVSIRWDGTDEKTHLKITGNKRPGAEQPNRPSIIKMAPMGDLALAEVNHDIYVVTVPKVGGEGPTVSVANPENASVPVKKLTDIGGQFPAWSRDGRKVHWSIGNAHLVYDLDTAKRVEEEIASRKEQESEEEEPEGEEEKKEEEGYKPVERRVLLDAQRDIPQGVAVLRNARVITMDGDQVLERGDILVRNNRIVAVGRSGSLQVPGDARQFDLKGLTVLPGFVDTHSHMRPSFGIEKSEAWTYEANLAYGVTTTRDPQTSTTDVLTYGDMVTAGKMLGPRIYSTGPGVFGDYTEDPIRDLDHARDVLKRYSDYYHTNYIKMYMAGNREQRQWIIQAAREQGLLPTTEGGLDLQYNVTMMLDGYPGQEHAFPIYPLYQDVVKTVIETGIAYTPTLIVSYGGIFGENFFFTRMNPHGSEKLRRFTPHPVLDHVTRRRGQGVDAGPAGWALEEEYIFPKHAEIAKRIVEGGGRVGVGSHGQLQGLGYHWELWALQSGGMTNHEALEVATSIGASDLGLSGDLGSIEEGKLADLLVLEKNPLEDIHNTNSLRYVMKNGRLYDANTLDEIWPRQRKAKLPDQDEPTGVTAGVH